MFWKKKPVKLIFYTSDKNTFDFFRPRLGSDMLPSWWKKIETKKETSMKGCVGLIHSYSNAIVIPMWSDCSISVLSNGEYFYKFFDGVTEITTHSQEQRGDFAPNDEYTHFKIRSPWVVHCDEDIKFVFTQNAFSFLKPDDFIPLTGVIDFKYQHSTNLNLFVKNPPVEKTVSLTANTPFVFIYPMTERNIEIEYRLITIPEWDDIMKEGLVYEKNAFFRKKKLMKELESSKSKCPFGFGGDK